MPRCEGQPRPPHPALPLVGAPASNFSPLEKHVPMITGPLKSQIDQLWERFWTGGIANGLTVIEQITYLLFARRLDEIHTAREKRTALTGERIDQPIFKKNQADLRWSRFKDFDPERMFKVFRDDVFPFIKQLNLVEMCSESTATRPAPGSKLLMYSA